MATIWIKCPAIGYSTQWGLIVEVILVLGLEDSEEHGLRAFCGFASKSDAADPILLAIATGMADSPTDVFGNKLDGWVRHWSRIIEFPFAFFAIQRFFRTQEARQPIQILESGCGVTPLPFWLSRFGTIHGVDIDEATGREWHQSKAVRDGRATFVLGDMQALPYKDRAFDAGFSVSAVEHCANPQVAVAELLRVIKIEGCFVLTMDVNLHGDHGVSRIDFQKIQEMLSEHVRPLYPLRWLVPSDLLTSQTLARSRHIGRRIARYVMDRAAAIESKEFAIWVYAGIRTS